MAGRTLLDKVWTRHAVASAMLLDAEIGAFEARHVGEWPWIVPGRRDGDPRGERARAGQ
jgi:hypothetical protein